MSRLLSACGLRRDYVLEGEVVQAVRGVSLDIDEGEYVAIVGPSGCGKSTLLNLLGAIDRPSAGTVTLRGRDVSRMSDREVTEFRLHNIGFIFQRFYLMPILTALENIELPMAERGVPAAERRQRARELLSYVELEHRARHRPPQLSGGEQQRVAIARALANRPALVLADEPTGELDARTGAEIIGLFNRLNRDGTTLVIVTHDEELARSARRVIHMRDGEIVRDDVVVGDRAIDVAFQVRDALTGEWRVDGRERWPVRTLIAYLFDGRECETVRTLLAAGTVSDGRQRATWDPIVLTPGEFTAIERTLPPPRPLPPHRAPPPDLTDEADVRVVVPHDQPSAWVRIDAASPVVASVAAQAEYVRFDYGPWADLYQAPLTLEQADVLLACAEPWQRELFLGYAQRFGAGVQVRVRLAGVLPPWGSRR